MRQIQHKQLQIGEVDIGSIKLDHHSRADIPQILIGLQHIDVNTKARDRVFALLEQAIPENITPHNGLVSLSQVLKPFLRRACRFYDKISLYKSSEFRVPIYQGLQGIHAVKTRQ